MTIELDGIVKRFGAFTALDGVTLSIVPGEFIALLGPSGSGKTTLLRILAGLEQPDAGAIRFRGKEVVGRPARERRVGFVFQHYALFRHMTIAENIAFGLKVKPRALRPSRAEIRRRVDDLLRLVQLDALGDRYPSQLSGGQRQRVALARALAIEPSVLLLDEPFGALDAKVRRELRGWLRRLHDTMGLTSIFVTHDQEEALELADRVVVMNEGCIAQVGTPTEVYEQPASAFVCEFLGNANRFSCVVDHGKVRIGDFVSEAPGYQQASEMPALAFVRPHELLLEPDPCGPGLPAVIEQILTSGPSKRIECTLDGLKALAVAEMPSDRREVADLERGQAVRLLPRRLRIFPVSEPHLVLPKAPAVAGRAASKAP
jgi:sulfate transport system ATP-binding protein